MSKFCVTFGQRFRRDEHCFDKRIHPDGWVGIDADSLDEAIRRANVIFGNDWSNVYAEDQISREYFPSGELMYLRSEFPTVDKD